MLTPEHLETFRASVVLSLEMWLEEMPELQRDEPMIGAGHETLSPRRIVAHVKNKTPLGDELLIHALSLHAAAIFTSGAAQHIAPLKPESESTLSTDLAQSADSGAKKINAELATIGPLCTQEESKAIYDTLMREDDCEDSD